MESHQDPLRSGNPSNRTTVESSDCEGEKSVWQRRFWEHAIRSDEDYARHIDYVHWNPVKHGLVRRVADWPCSSFHPYVDLGILLSNWAGGVEEGGEIYGEPFS
jgi:putative transposase